MLAQGCNNCFFLIIRRPPRSALFPYATLVRSDKADELYSGNLLGAVAVAEMDSLLHEMRVATRDTVLVPAGERKDRKSTRLNSSHANMSYAVFCLNKKKNHTSDLPSPYSFVFC